MTSVSLNNDIRDAIAKKAVDHKFGPIFEALATAEDALAREAHASIYTADELSKVAKLPVYWVRRDACLLFNVGGQRLRFDAKEGLPVPYANKSGSGHGYDCREIGSIPFGDLCDRLQAHALAVEKAKEEKRAAHKAVRTMLDSVRTSKKLAELWPEGAPFYEGMFSPDQLRNLPAIRVDDVNAVLGLSPAAEAGV